MHHAWCAKIIVHHLAAVYGTQLRSLAPSRTPKTFAFPADSAILIPPCGKSPRSRNQQPQVSTVPIPETRWCQPIPLPPKTALDIVLAAIDVDLREKKLLERFSFVFEGREVEYQGRYYGYIYAPDGGEESEWGGDSFREMLSDVVSSTEKALWQMLDELPPDAVTVEFDPDWPPR